MTGDALSHPNGVKDRASGRSGSGINPARRAKRQRKREIAMKEETRGGGLASLKSREEEGWIFVPRTSR